MDCQYSLCQHHNSECQSLLLAIPLLLKNQWTSSHYSLSFFHTFSSSLVVCSSCLTFCSLFMLFFFLTLLPAAFISLVVSELSQPPLTTSLFLLLWPCSILLSRKTTVSLGGLLLFLQDWEALKLSQAEVCFFLLWMMALFILEKL